MTDWEQVMQQYEAVRQSGHTNMFDRSNVKNFAEQAGFDELVEVIEQGDYAECMDRYDPEEHRL